MLLSFYLTACSANLFTRKVSSQGGSRVDSNAVLDTGDYLNTPARIDYEAYKKLTRAENSRLIAYDIDEITEDLDFSIREKVGIPLNDIDLDSEKQALMAGVAAVQSYSMADFNAMALVMKDKKPTLGQDSEDFLVSDIEILTESLNEFNDNYQNPRESSSQENLDDALQNNVFVPIDEPITDNLSSIAEEDEVFFPPVGQSQEESAEANSASEDIKNDIVPDILNPENANIPMGEVSTRSIIVPRIANTDAQNSQQVSGEQYYESVLSQASSDYGFPQYQEASAVASNPVKVDDNTTIYYSELGLVEKTIDLGEDGQIMLSTASDGSLEVQRTFSDGSNFILIKSQSDQSIPEYNYYSKNSDPFGINYGTGHGAGEKDATVQSDGHSYTILSDQFIGVVQEGDSIIISILRQGQEYRKECEGSKDSQSDVNSCLASIDESDQVKKDESDDVDRESELDSMLPSGAME